MKSAQKIVSKNKIINVACATLVIVTSCSSGSNDSSVENNSASTVSEPTTAETVTSADTSTTAVDVFTSVAPTIEMLSVVMPFTAADGTGTITIFGDSSPVAAWFANQPGEVSLDLVDADIDDAGSVVGELMSFWFFQDDDSGDVPPTIYESGTGELSDSLGTRYVVESQGLPPAPVAETTTTTSSTSTTTTSTTTTTSSAPSEAPEPSVPQSTTSTTTSTTSTTTTTTTLAPAVLQVQVLNGSGVAGAAGRLTDRLSQAGFVVLPAGNAPERYSSSAVYFAEGWQGKAEEILETADIDEIEGVTAMPQQFAGEAAVVVLLGTDTAPAVVREQAGLRPRPNFDVKLPLGDDVPRDRFVPGLAAIQIYTPQNDNDPEVFLYIDTLARALGSLGTFADEEWSPVSPRGIEARTTEKYETAVEAIEKNLEWLGFTPQNVCGAPAGYSFRDLLEPTREWDEGLKTYGGDAIFTTDRLIELHGGERINPEANLDFYIGEAVQTAYDSLRLAELSAEVEAPQMILCDAWKLPSGEIPEAANSYWYALLTPGIQPRESLLSQGTYHIKEISKNGNYASVIVCHSSAEREIRLYWREAGYRAEVLGTPSGRGCQAALEEYPYIRDDTDLGEVREDTVTFSFGERVFSAEDLLEFPRLKG